MANQVVARFTDGRTLKGTCLDIAPERPKCHVRTVEGEMVPVLLRDLKALFIVKSVDGDAKHVEGRDIAPVDARLRGTKLIEVSFHDGEKIVGLTTRYPPLAPFFFVVPVDTDSNNQRILVNKEQIESMRLVDVSETC